MNRNLQIICIGASAGGITAIQKILKGLDRSFRLPIVVVQHIPESSEVALDRVFQPFFKGLAIEVTDKTPLEFGNCYFAPAGYHLLVEQDHTLSLSQDEPVNFSRPSIDVTFESAANAFGKDVCAILLTGANGDGAAGLKYIQENGGVTMVQDPNDAEFPQMPTEALQIMDPDFVGGVPQITSKLGELRDSYQN